MTDKTNTNQDNSAKRKTLSLKSSTLGLSKASDNNASDIESRVKMYTENKNQVKSANNRTSVVVVTKGRSTTSQQSVKDDDLNKKISLLKQAENLKQTEFMRQEAIRLQKEEERLAEERIAAEQAALEAEAIAAAAAAAALEEEKRKIAASEKATTPSSRQEAQKYSKVVIRNAPASSRTVAPKNKVRNLDNLNREDAVKIQVEPDTDIKDPTFEIESIKPRKHISFTTPDPVEREIVTPKKPEAVEKRSSKRISVTKVMMMDGEDAVETSGRKFRSIAAMKRAKDKARRKYGETVEKEKIAREVLIPDVISVQDLSSRMSEKSADVIKMLMKLGMMVTVNQSIDADTAEIVVGEFGHNFKRITSEEIERTLINEQEDREQDLLPRPPVVTIMGHVDHGKTSLLDALRSTDIAAGEAGGITQHIGAYQVILANGKHITFLDTPGHEAFTAMRLRGAKVTDIVILVVAADDGIMEQTIEASSHAKAAGVPIIVAINKIDKPQADVHKVKMELLQHNLVPEDMGGDIITVEVSAKQMLNLDKLEEAILLQAEVLELRANPNRLATGAVIESKIDKGRGPIATLLVQKGTLRIGDSIVAGTAYGTIRALINDKGQYINEAPPAMPVEVLGMNTVPTSGDAFLVATNEKVAKDICQHRINLEKERKLVNSRRATLEQLFMKSANEGSKELPVIVKGDVHGSVEAICNSLLKLSNDEITVNILHSAAGGITESDITLASASGAVVLGFNVRANNQAREAAKINGVDIRYYSIIYSLVDDIKAAMSGMLSPIIKEQYLGSAEIKQVFNLTKFGKVAGCYITEGLAKRNCNARLIRDNVVIYDGKLKALKRFKDDLKEVRSGFECGISLENYEDMKTGDKLEFYETTQESRQL
jgi:translation initiation factor IF-2